MKFKVKLISKDKHVFEFSTYADSESSANEKALSRIEKHGWENYQYKVISTEKIND